MGITKRLKNKPHLKISRIGTFFTSNLGEKTPKKLVGVEVGLERMNFAHSKIKNYFPLSSETYELVSFEEMSFFDQFIFRFTKLQDSIGNKLIRYILESMAENTRELSQIDIFSKAEQLNIIPSAEDWLSLRAVRNKLTHEYPSDHKEIIEGLNSLNDNINMILIVWQHIEEFIKGKFGYLV